MPGSIIRRGLLLLGGLCHASACVTSSPVVDATSTTQPPAPPSTKGLVQSAQPVSAVPPVPIPAVSAPPIPIDERPVVRAATPPVPISGGTLLITANGTRAIASDPDRDRVSIVDIPGARLERTIALEVGDEPGRLVEDDSAHIHVALRRAGAVVTLDPATGAIVSRRAVCRSPRGIAFDAASHALRVVCADGLFVTLPLDAPQPSEWLQLESSLRDVIVDGQRAFVSTFKRAELIALDGQVVVGVRRPEPGHRTVPGPAGTLLVDTIEPEVAWRTVANPSGGMVMLHQGARRAEIQVPEPGAPPLPGAVPYYGAASCASVVQGALTLLDAEGQPRGSLRIESSLAVDVAVSPTSGTIAVAHAGRVDPGQPRLTIVSARAPAATASVTLFGQAAFNLSTPPDQRPDTCVSTPAAAPVQGQITAVGYAPDGTLLAQRREPAAIVIMKTAAGAPSGWDMTTVELPGASVEDTGHSIFHRDAGAGIACASCHPEGGDDGHVWRFSDVGPRRTQALYVGLEGTAPFHWAGDLEDLSELVEEVLVTRMSGVHQSPERTDALSTWLFALRPPSPLRTADDPGALRGKLLFEGQARCSSCHEGPRLTNNKTEDVGTGVPLQVPSLVAIGHRAPFMHAGCAPALRDRFSIDCGGATHGELAGLADAQIDDLVAYLESL
jgi:mono/diheme cytochrome c family protein